MKDNKDIQCIAAAADRGGGRKGFGLKTKKKKKKLKKKN